MSYLSSSLGPISRFVDRTFWGKASEPSKHPVRAGPPSEAEESLRTIKHPQIPGRSYRTGEYAKTNIRDLKQERVEPNVADSDNYGDSDIDMEGEVEAGHSNSVNGPSQVCVSYEKQELGGVPVHFHGESLNVELNTLMLYQAF